MDLTLQDERGEDVMLLAPLTLDYACGIGDDPENDFELTFARPVPAIKAGMAVYAYGTPYGGILRKQSPSGDGVSWEGDTWEGVLASRVIVPDGGTGALSVSGEANSIVSSLVSRLGLSGVFSVAGWSSGVSYKGYTFGMYDDLLAGLTEMLSSKGLKLRIRHDGSRPQLAAVPLKDWSRDEEFDAGLVDVQVTVDHIPVNHLVARGEDSDENRVSVELYMDGSGNVSERRTFSGRWERQEYYNYTSADRDKLVSDGTKRLKKYWDEAHKVEVSMTGGGERYDLGDVIGGTDPRCGVSATAAVNKKVLTIDALGNMTVEVKAG